MTFGWLMLLYVAGWVLIALLIAAASILKGETIRLAAFSLAVIWMIGTCIIPSLSLTPG